MEARAVHGVVLLTALSCVAASHRTPNFVVTAPTAEVAQQVAVTAEHYRKQLAIEWLGQELPNWYAPCPVSVQVGQMGAGGATSFNFDRGEVFGWNMKIQGPMDRLLDSVVPHEVSHTIFASYFRRPLPRWADEGAATLAEADCEKRRQEMTVKQLIGTRQRIPLKSLVGMKEYPSDMKDVLTLYAEGYSLAELLVQTGGRGRYLKFLADADKFGWDPAVKANYGFKNVEALETHWHEWVIAGSPRVTIENVAQAETPAKSSTDDAPAAVVRGQSPAEELADKAASRDVAFAALPRNQADLIAPTPKRSGSATANAAPHNAPPAPRSKEGLKKMAFPSVNLGFAKLLKPKKSAEVADSASQRKKRAVVRAQEPTEEPEDSGRILRASAEELDADELAPLERPAPRRTVAGTTAGQSPRAEPRASSTQFAQADDETASPRPVATPKSTRPRVEEERLIDTRVASRDAGGSPARKRRRTQWSEFPQEKRFSPITSR